MSIGGVVERVRKPAYTGENRCLPCTAVNVVLAGVTGAVLGLVWVPLGVAALAVSLAAIYLRGYLVPYTPTLTKRYFPERVLAWFEKAPEPAAGGVGGGDVAASDVEATLREVGAIEECPARDDLCLTPAFREEWRAEIAARRDGNVGVAAAGLLDFGEGEVSVTEDEGAFDVRVDGRPVGRWPSRAACVADVAATEVLAEWDPEWDARDREGRNALLNSLRLFVEACPDCGGAVELGEEVVSSCCRERAVAAARCTDCGARVFETALPEGA